MSDRTPALLQRLHTAQSIARQGGWLMNRRFQHRSSFVVNFKGNQDYVTSVDLEVEKFVLGQISDVFRDDGLICEEGGGVPSRSLWVIDPIDGTANFARGIPHFCISIAYLTDGHPVIGVIFDPVRDEMFVGLRGGGATLNGVRLGVSTTQNIRFAQVEIGLSTHTGIPSSLLLGEGIAKLGAGITTAGSGALGLAYVAAGRLDAYCESHINSWDVLAGLVLVTEAGGYASNFLANDGLTKGNSILACTPSLRDVLAKTTEIAG
jgi:myo-inositol-1(or 4)-monophosphatase